MCRLARSEKLCETLLAERCVMSETPHRAPEPGNQTRQRTSSPAPEQDPSSLGPKTVQGGDGQTEDGRTGLQILADASGCHEELLDDPSRIQSVVRDIARTANLSVVQVIAHKFSPQGVTVLALLAESHIAVHTWPECGTCSLDIFLCSHRDPSAIVSAITSHLRPFKLRTQTISRGSLPLPRSTSDRRTRPPKADIAEVINGR